jgi:para-nitrobenzyl esterase
MLRLSRELSLAALLLIACACARAQYPGLVGTSWQLVRFQVGDGRVLTPDDKSKYTFSFGTGGALSARIDCNRGSGTWKSAEPGLMEIGPFAITRALCPPGSLFDQVVKQLGEVRTYLVKDGHLYLSAMAPGGIYELEPIAFPRAR